MRTHYAHFEFVQSHPLRSSHAFRERDLWNASRRWPASFWLDVGRADHLAPLLGFHGDERAEVGGRACQYRATQIGKARFEFGINKASVDLRVELVDDLGGRVLR